MTIDKLTERQIGLRDRLVMRKTLGEQLTTEEQTTLDNLNRVLDAHLPPKPELPESVRQANEEIAELLKLRVPKRRKLKP